MRLPVIKHLVEFIEQNDEDYINETMETLEHLIEAPGIKDEELDVIGELLSNLWCSRGPQRNPKWSAQARGLKWLHETGHRID